MTFHTDSASEVARPAPGLFASERYVLELAAGPGDVAEAQRLRYDVFNLELGEGLATSRESGLDSDEFDSVCDHLLVRDSGSRTVVGTYRLQSGPTAAGHIGYYSEREFDFGPFAAHRAEILELGRACVARSHRNQTVISLLWRGIAWYAQARKLRYLMGCSSLTSQDPGVGLAVYARLAETHLAPVSWRTKPLPAWECRTAARASAVPIPRLMAAYLALGASICGQPALDREFKTIDFLTWLDLNALAPQIFRKFFPENGARAPK